MASEEPADGPARRFGAFWNTRYLPVAAAVLAVGLAMPAIGAGRLLDDHFHRTVLLGTSRFRHLLGSPSEMFRFFRGDPVRTGQLMDLGLYPWWTDPVLKGEFLQALTVLTHRLDYALWPDSPALMHAQKRAQPTNRGCAGPGAPRRQGRVRLRETSRVCIGHFSTPCCGACARRG